MGGTRDLPFCVGRPEDLADVKYPRQSLPHSPLFFPPTSRKQISCRPSRPSWQFPLALTRQPHTILARSFTLTPDHPLLPGSSGPLGPMGDGRSSRSPARCRRRPPPTSATSATPAPRPKPNCRAAGVDGSLDTLVPLSLHDRIPDSNALPGAMVQSRLPHSHPRRPDPDTGKPDQLPP